MMDEYYSFYFVVILAVSFTSLICGGTVVEYHDDKRPCTYFEKTRFPRFEQGLVNCSWYVSNSCCKRTEVTSVFSSNPMPLYLATQDCRNRLNYMMCYFCSPDQFNWYKEEQVHICETFCSSVYMACKDAVYSGFRIGEKYNNGTSFCEAQNFRVVNSKFCFRYDATVFARASDVQAIYSDIAFILIFSKVLKHFQYL